MSALGVLGVNAAVIALLMIGTWLVSIPLRNASIVDIVWGFGFVVVAWSTFIVADGYDTRQLLLTLLTTVWGLRLAGYLLWRNHGKGEDFRYVSMRKNASGSFVWRSLWLVFGLQGVIMWVVSLPVQLGQVPEQRGIFALTATIGVLLWLVGFGFETIGDGQLARFKSDPANAGRVMDKGLWRYTRHPNYFGDFCVWWGLFAVAASTWTGATGIVGPIVMSFMLLRVSGVAMLERSLRKRKPQYEAYVAATNAFFPGPPRPPAAGNAR